MHDAANKYFYIRRNTTPPPPSLLYNLELHISYHCYKWSENNEERNKWGRNERTQQSARDAIQPQTLAKSTSTGH
jgi:hypothetical protein